MPKDRAGTASPPDWKAYFADVQAALTIQERDSFARPVAAQCEAVLSELAAEKNESQKLFNALAVGQLKSMLTGMDPADSSTSAVRSLVALNGVLATASPRLSVVLLEHGFLNPLAKLHERCGSLTHPVGRCVVLLATTAALQCGSLSPGSLEAVAGREELRDLVVGHLVFAAAAPDQVLSSGAGVGTVLRCMQLCWELTRAPSPNCKAFRAFLRDIDLPARLAAITAAASPPAAGAATTTDPAAAVAALDAAHNASATTATTTTGAGSGPGPAAGTAQGAAAGPGSGPDPLFEERLAAAAQACSLLANLVGLGAREVDPLSRAGLAPQRQWLLRPGSLGALRQGLEGLAEGLLELRRRMAAAAAGAEASHGGQGQQGAGQEQGGQAPQAESPEDDLCANKLPLHKLLLHAEGAVRNLLFLVGLPTVVMGKSEEDVVEGCGFVIRHAFGLFTEGYVDTMRALRAAVGDQPGLPPYPGDYGPFVRAFAGHVSEVAPGLGVQLEDWGVRFTGEQAARDLPAMEVKEGVDARIAQSWLKGQIQGIINWGHRMLELVRLAEQAKLPPQQPQQGQGQGQGQQAAATVAAPRPLDGPRSQAQTAAGQAGRCAACGAAPPADGPPLKACSQCRTVAYCSRACQVGDWPRHKTSCQAAAAAAKASPRATGEATGSGGGGATPASGANAGTPAATGNGTS